MASYETIPVVAAEDGLLLDTPKPKTNLKALVGGAAIASFIIGMVAATAVTQHAIATQTNLKSKHHNHDPVYVTQKCEPTQRDPNIHVEWVDDDERFGETGWMCVRNKYGEDVHVVKYDGDGDSVDDMFEDYYYSGVNGDKKNYQANHVHTGCDVAAVDEYEGGGPSPGTVKCLDDNFPTNGLGPAALAVQATRAATRYYDTVPDGEPLFNDGGGFWYDFGSDRLVWAVDGGDAVAYAYDRDAYDDSYKLWKSETKDNAGFYKVSLNCDYNSGDKYPNGHSCSKDSECESGDCHKGDGPYKNKCKTPSSSSRRSLSTKPTCWLDFKCLQSWVDDEALFGDC